MKAPEAMTPTYLRVKARPGAREERVEELGEGRYEVWTRAPAERGLANAAILSLLAARLGIPVKRLRLAKGAAGPSKIVQILGR